MSPEPSGARPASDHSSSDQEGTSSARGSGQREQGKEAGETSESRRSLLGDLIRRRVPQVVAGYLGVTWTLFELMKWLTNQYLISPYLGQAILFGLLLFLPSVVLVTYRHGRPGPDAWTRVERVGVTGNAVIAVVVLFAVFGGTELGSMVRPAQGTADEATPGESGNAVVRTAGGGSERRPVPKKEFRKRVALFYFGTAPGTRADTALRRVAPAALQADLEQDLFVSLFPPDRFADELRDRGYGEGLGVPLGLKQEVARRVNAQYLLSGQVGRTDDGSVRLTTRLRETTGDLVAERSFEGEALFALVDRASTQLKEDLGLPAAHLEDAADLPVTQVFTPSLDAAKHFARGEYLDAFHDADQKALEAYRRAVEADSTFASGYIGKGAALWALEGRERAAPALRTAQRHSYRLPETRKYWLRGLRLLRIKNRPEAALQVCRQWTSLYPYDLTAWRLKAAIHRELLQSEAAVASYRRAQELAPQSKDIERGLVRSLLRAGQSEEALRRVESFGKAYPRDDRGPLLEGTAHWMQGHLDEAEGAFRRARSLDSSRARTALIALYRAQGQFGEARSMIRTEVQPESEARAWYERWYQHWLRGRIDRSLAVYDSLRATDVIRSNPPNPSLDRHVCMYYEGRNDDRIDRAFNRLRTVRDTLPDAPPGRVVGIELGIAQCEIARGRFGRARRHLQTADSLAQEEMTPVRRVLFKIDDLWGRLREKQGQFEQAAKRYEAFLETWSGYRQSLTSTHGLPRLRLARTYEKLGQTQDAEEAYRAALAVRPAYPRLNYHYAQFLTQQERTGAVKTHLRRTLDAWAPADPDFRLKQRADALADSLGITHS